VERLPLLCVIGVRTDDEKLEVWPIELRKDLCGKLFQAPRSTLISAREPIALGVDRVVARLEADVVVASQADAPTPAWIGHHRRQRQHRLPVFLDAVVRSRTDAPVETAIRSLVEPLCKLRVEVSHPDEAPSG
jgi:hypothetical protein